MIAKKYLYKYSPSPWFDSHVCCSVTFKNKATHIHIYVSAYKKVLTHSFIHSLTHHRLEPRKLLQNSSIRDMDMGGSMNSLGITRSIRSRGGQLVLSKLTVP